MSELKCLVCDKTLTGKQKKFCSVQCQAKCQYRKTRNLELKDTVPKVCQICGNPLTGRQRKACSEECLKVWNTRYNSKYILARRAVDEDFAKKSAEWSARASSKSYAKRMWKARLKSAEEILALAKQEDARLLIAEYLDENFQIRRNPFSRKETVEEAKKASEIIQSLGDLSS